MWHLTSQVISLSCFYFCINRMILQPLILWQESRSRQWREPCPCNLKKQNKTQQKPNQTIKQAQTNLTSASSCFIHYSMKEQTQPIKALVLMGLEASLFPWTFCNKTPGTQAFLTLESKTVLWQTPQDYTRFLGALLHPRTHHGKVALQYRHLQTFCQTSPGQPHSRRKRNKLPNSNTWDLGLNPDFGIWTDMKIL